MRMDKVKNFFDSLMSRASGIAFEYLALALFCAFALVFIVSLIFCIASQKVRRRSKKPFLCAVNVFAAITLAAFASAYPLAGAIGISAALWCVGYLMYGLLCLFNGEKKSGGQSVAVGEPIEYRPQKTGVKPAAIPAAYVVDSGVRLEHALSISDKLLLKNLGRGDRQELEKIKTSLTVLKVKGSLTPQEGENLNDMFNALLKLMAKYDL